MREKAAVTLILIAMVIYCGVPSAGTSQEETAVAASDAWLTLVDNEDYAGSWEQAAAYFQDAVTEEQWIHSIRSFRKPLGKVSSRTLISTQFTKTLPGAPDGAYVIIQYRSSFANKKSAVETVTPMQDTDKQWRVSGYYIK